MPKFEAGGCYTHCNMLDTMVRVVDDPQPGLGGVHLHVIYFNKWNGNLLYQGTDNIFIGIDDYPNWEET